MDKYKEDVIIMIAQILAVAMIIWVIVWAFTSIKLPNLTPKPMSNDDIVLQSKKCHDAGIGVSNTYSGLSGEIIGVQCDPSKKFDE